MRVSLFFVISFLISAQGLYGQKLGRLHVACSEILGDNIKVSANKEQLSLRWQGSGAGKLYPVLRALTPSAIPDDLVRAYTQVDLALSMPLDACKFETGEKGDFRCQFRGNSAGLQDLGIQADAKVWSSSKDSQKYEGRILKAELRSRIVKGKQGKRYYRLKMILTLAGPSGEPGEVIKMESSNFSLFHSSFNGFQYEPECIVDRG